MLCSVPLHHLPQAPAWSDAIEQQFASQQEGGPEAVSIIWTNRNTLTGAGDNFFDDVFGTSLGVAQGVVDAALAAWARVITSFNRGDGTSTLQISITMNRDGMGNFVGGYGGVGAPSSTAPADGLPRTGSIAVNAGDLSADPNDDNGWFLDPTPNDYSEFQGNILTPFAADHTNDVGSDLYSLITAEVTHCLGFISAKPGVPGFNGYRLETSGLTHFTGQADSAEGGGNKGFFYTFDGPTIDHLMTSYNSGDTDTDSWGNVIHTSGGTGNINFSGQNWRGTDDDGNALYGNERLLPSHVTATILKDAYGYTIDPPAKFGSMYSVLDSVTGILNIRGADNSNDIITLTRNGSLLTVAVDIEQDVPGSHNLPGTGSAPAWTTEYNLAAVTMINVFPRSGNDTVLISADMGAVPFVVNDTAGSDKLQIQGGAGYDSFSTPNSATVVTTNGQVAYTSMETLEIYTGDGDADVDLRSTNASSARVTGGANAQTINFAALDSGTPTIVDLGGGSDVLNFGTASLVPPVGSPVTVFGGIGDDVINLAPSNFASVTISQPVTVFGDTGNDTLVLGSNNADSVDANITFDGGTHAGPTGDRVVINDQAVGYNVSYTVSNTVVTRDGFNLPHTISYSNTEGIVLNCGFGGDTLNLGNAIAATVDMHLNDGNDILNVGGGNLSGYFPQAFNGGDGQDRITFDNRLDSTNRIWDMHNDEVVFGGLISLITTNFEDVGVLAGTGQDEFDFKGTLVQGFNVDGGPGADDFVLGYQGSVYFNNAVTFLGGTGPDLFTVNDAAVNSASYAPLVMDGGAAEEFNGLLVNEPLASGYELGPGYFAPQGQGTFAFSGMLQTVITGNAAANVFTIYSAGVDLVGTFTIDAGSGDDTFHLVPRPSGYTFKGLTINGQPGVDTLFLDSALSTDESYTIGSNILQIARPGGTETITSTSMNAFTLTAGSGNDSISMNQYSAGIPVTVNGGFGDDTMNVGGGNLSANITSIAAFTFNGQPGFDRFNLNNASEPGAWQYIRDTGIIRADRLTAPVGYFVTLGETSVEEMTVNAGPAGDAFYTRAIEPGASCILNAGAGLDGLFIADSTQNLQGIQGVIRYNAGTDGGNLRVSDNADATGDVGHLTATTLGAFPGDNLFGAGGWLEFSNVVDSAISPGITLNCSSSADTIYATPLASARVTITGGNPPAAPGDTLNLALASATDYVVNGTPASGNVTSSNLKTLSYTGFETGPNIDDVAPAVINADINVNGIPAFADGGLRRQSIDVQFSEDTSALISASSLTLMNVTTNQTIPTANIAVEYDLATHTAHFTFPGYANGVLPDGDYAGRVLAGLPDFFGNGLPADSEFDFFFLQGDANHDRAVNLADFNLLAANFGTTGGAHFGQGDFNYDGNVNLADFNIFAAQFGSTLGGASARAISGARGGRIIDDLRDRLA